MFCYAGRRQRACRSFFAFEEGKSNLASGVWLRTFSEDNARKITSGLSASAPLQWQRVLILLVWFVDRFAHLTPRVKKTRLADRRSRDSKQDKSKDEPPARGATATATTAVTAAVNRPAAG